MFCVMGHRIKERNFGSFRWELRFIVLLCFLAFGHLKAQVVIKPDDRDDYAKNAQSQYSKGNWEGGKNITQKGLAKYPKDSDLKMMMGKYYLHLQQYDKARYELVKALEYNADNVEAKQMLVNVEMESGRYSSAICYVNELLQVNPYWKGLWRKKIQLYELQGNTVEAERLRKRISQIYPNDQDFRKDYLYSAELNAEKKRKEGRIDEALALSKDLVAQDPNNKEYYQNIINDYLKSGDERSAQVYIERALIKFPGDMSFVNKKIGLLSSQKRYDELLDFIQQQLKRNNSGALQQQYNYYLIEAAHNAKSNSPETLYGKILEKSPGDDEAFNYLFNYYINTQQYEEALRVLNKYRKVRGASKLLSIKELMVYNRMGNVGKASLMTKKLFEQYPHDKDLQQSYAAVMLAEAKTKISEENYSEAILCCQMVKEYGEEDAYKTAQNYLYNIYITTGDYNNALRILAEYEELESSNADLFVKKATVYFKQEQYTMAVSTYEHAIRVAREDQRAKYIGGYSDMLTLIIKDLNEQYQFEKSNLYVKRWLQYDPNSKDALKYAINLSYVAKDYDEMLRCAQRGSEVYPQDVFFKIKLAEIKVREPQNYPSVYDTLLVNVHQNPYHKDLINAFVQISEDYSTRLIKQKEIDRAMPILDTAIRYAPANNSLKYLKGLAFEKYHLYDSAYIYQSRYSPSELEKEDFLAHLYYLNSKGYRNDIGISYLRSRQGDDYTISTISSIEYNRYGPVNSYSLRMNYAGRETGKGLQIQAGWGREWTTRTRTHLDVAWANMLFPKWVVNGSIYHDFNVFGGVEGELGGGYRRLPGQDNMGNVVVGLTKDMSPFRLNVRFNNFENNGVWLYSVSANARYYLTNPKNYITVVGSAGSSPDVDMIDRQFYNGTSDFNTMVGAGMGYMPAKTVTFGWLGSWYTYKVTQTTSKNLYTLYFNLNVAF